MPGVWFCAVWVEGGRVEKVYGGVYSCKGLEKSIWVTWEKAEAPQQTLPGNIEYIHQVL